MATIDIKRAHTLDLAEAKKRAEALATNMQEKLGIRWSWEGDTIKFDAPSGAAKGANGTVKVDTSQVRVEIDLPFLLRAVMGTIDGKATEKLDKLIA